MDVHSPVPIPLPHLTYLILPPFSTLPPHPSPLSFDFHRPALTKGVHINLVKDILRMSVPGEEG